MADRMGSYHGAFFLAGSVVMLGAALPFVLLFIKGGHAYRTEHRVEVLHSKPSKHQTAECGVQEIDVPCHYNQSFEENLGSNYSIVEANSESTCDDVNRTVIDTSLPSDNVNLTLSSAEETKYDENVSHLLVDYICATGTSESKSGGMDKPTLADCGHEATAGNTQMPEQLDSKTYQVEVEINSPLTSTTNMDKQQLSLEHLVDDTKF